MNIFESLENLNVSEECFNDILNMVEELLSEDTGNWEPAKYKNKWSVYDKTSCVYYPTKGGRKGAEKRCKELNTKYPEKPRIDLSYENLQVSKEYINSIMGIVEDLLGTTQKKLKDSANKYDKLKDRIVKVLKAKKKNGTLNDTVRDKAWGVIYGGKHAKEFDKARILADEAERLHRETHDYPDEYYEERKKK